ncbi:MAG: phenylalanine--tRNA ligase subunit beta, partial [Clostridiales bacterium]|nr:phenylalanine--tRNA ligase subunit beta [Candidatus Apopatocola equi]
GVNFFTLKGDVEAILKSLRIRGVRFEAEKNNPSFHPGRCATLWIGEDCLGTIGQVHPEAAAAFGADAELYAAELSLPELLAHRAGDPVYAPLPRVPPVTPDQALLCDSTVTVGQLSECIRRCGGETLRRVELFDIYTGKGIAEGKKSVAFSLTLRSDEGSLTAEHAEEVVSAILAGLKDTLGAVLR